MGVAENVSFDTYPKQDDYLHSRVSVCFDYDTSRTVGGLVVRSDAEAPGEMIFLLDNGRFVRAVECMYQPEEK